MQRICTEIFVYSFNVFPFNVFLIVVVVVVVVVAAAAAVVFNSITLQIQKIFFFIFSRLVYRSSSFILKFFVFAVIPGYRNPPSGSLRPEATT